MNYQRHPISSAFPDLRTDELRELRESVRTLGVLEPIMIFEGMILDGWQRYTVARELNVQCPVRRFSGNPQEAVEYAVAKQARRNMTKLERAAVLIELHSRHLAGRGNRSKSASMADFITLAALAARTGIGERTLRRARRLEQQAIRSVRIVLGRGLITADEAEKIASQPRDFQSRCLRQLLDIKKWKVAPFDPRAVLHVSGRFVFTTDRDLALAAKIQRSGVRELNELSRSGKNLGLVAAAGIARRSPEEQLRILKTAPWVQTLRKVPYGRFERRQLRTNPSCFELG